MARQTDSFFIRATLDAQNGVFTQSEIDLGAYVDALGKSVLKIHNVQVHLQDATALQRPPLYNAGTGAEVSWQLTTQGQAAIVRPSNRSVVSAGLTQFAEVGSGTGNGQLSAEAAGLNVHQFTDGYLIAVEQMFLGSEQTGLTSNTAVSVIMECTVETLTQSAAMALALSQQ
jgi:hypothetical protein